MTKREYYDALKADGAKLKAFNTMSLDGLAALYVERFGKAPDETAPPAAESQKPGQSEEDKAAAEAEKAKADAEAKAKAAEKKKADPAPARFPLLHFRNSGWCEALQRSYFRGNYRPVSKEEYEALKPFAASER